MFEYEYGLKHPRATENKKTKGLELGTDGLSLRMAAGLDLKVGLHLAKETGRGRRDDLRCLKLDHGDLVVAGLLWEGVVLLLGARVLVLVAQGEANDDSFSFVHCCDKRGIYVCVCWMNEGEGQLCFVVSRVRIEE
jgi:hypothetical protein